MNSVYNIRGSFLPGPTCILISLKSLSTVGHSAVHVHGVVTDWSYALTEFLVSSLFRAFLFLAILATFTLQMFF